MNDNQLCGIDQFGGGTYTTEGIVAICDTLKLNSSLTSLECEPDSLNSSPKCQDPLTVLAFCPIVSPIMASATEARWAASSLSATCSRPTPRFASSSACFSPHVHVHVHVLAFCHLLSVPSNTLLCA